MDRSLPLFEFLGVLDGPRDIGGLWEEGLEVDGGLRGLVGGVSGFLEGEARFKSKTAGSMASSEQ